MVQCMRTIIAIKWPTLKRKQLEPGELLQSTEIKFHDIITSIEIQSLLTISHGLRGDMEKLKDECYQ